MLEKDLNINKAMIMKSIEAIKENNATKITDLLLEQANINEKDEYGNTALHDFADNGNLEGVKLLIEHKAVIDIQNEQGESPLMRAVIRQYKPIVQKLLAEGANPNLPNKSGYTSVHKAAFRNDLEIMKLLVSYDGDIKAVTNSGSTVMHCVAVGVTQQSENWKLTTWLLNKGAPYKILNKQGYSVYDAFYSADWSYAELFKELTTAIVGQVLENE